MSTPVQFTNKDKRLHIDNANVFQGIARASQSQKMTPAHVNSTQEKIRKLEERRQQLLNNKVTNVASKQAIGVDIETAQNIEKQMRDVQKAMLDLNLQKEDGSARLVQKEDDSARWAQKVKDLEEDFASRIQAQEDVSARKVKELEEDLATERNLRIQVQGELEVEKQKRSRIRRLYRATLKETEINLDMCKAKLNKDWPKLREMVAENEARKARGEI